MAAVTDYVGRVIKISAQPYHNGTAKIVKIEPGQKYRHSDWSRYFVVTVETVEATEISRLGGYHVSRPYNGREIVMYHYSAERIARVCDAGETLVHVYSV